MKKKKINWIKAINFFLFIIIVFFALLVVFSKISLGKYRLFTVTSDSMRPSVKTGSIIIVRNASGYSVGDIISFSDPRNPKKIVTHRLVEIKTENNTTYGITKGDANKNPDPEKVYQKSIIGKIQAKIPYLGYPIVFLRTLPGLILLIIIPSTVIVYDEILNIKNELKKRKRKLRRNNKMAEKW